MDGGCQTGADRSGPGRDRPESRIRYPQLLGNGKGIIQVAILGGLSFGLSAALLVLKPLATAVCLGAGSPGGLFTGTLTIGVLLATVLSSIWSHIWPHTVPASYELIGGGAFLAASMQAPVQRRPGARADAPLRPADGADAGGGHRRDGDRPQAERAVDLLGAARPEPNATGLNLDAATVEALDAADDALPPRDEDEVSWPGAPQRSDK